MSIVFAADSHLNKHYSRMTPDQLAARRDRLRAGLERTIDHAIEQGAQVYIHGGDLFDGPNPRSTELVWVAGQLQRLADAGVRILLLGGNHDIPKTRRGGEAPQALFGAVRLAKSYTDPDRVEWWRGDLGGASLAVGGLPPNPRLSAEEDPIAGLVHLSNIPKADCVILVTHYAVEGTLHPLAEEATIPRGSIAQLSGHVDCVLCGHIHGSSDLEIAGIPVLFPGPTERLDFGEIEVGCGFLELTLDRSVDGGKPSLSWRHVLLEPQPMRRETIRGPEIPADRATRWLSAKLRAWSTADQILQIRLVGPLHERAYRSINFLEIWQLGNELNFYFDLDRHLLYILEDEEDAAGPSLTDRPSPRAEMQRVAETMRRSADSAHERELIDAAHELARSLYGDSSLEES